MSFTALGKVILLLAVGLAALGALLLLLGKFTGGRGLPGDLMYRRDGITVYFPLATSILISIILSLLVSLILWLANRGR